MSTNKVQEQTDDLGHSHETDNDTATVEGPHRRRVRQCFMFYFHFPLRISHTEYSFRLNEKFVLEAQQIYPSECITSGKNQLISKLYSIY